jgi:putative FmdB family regulatory protein
MMFFTVLGPSFPAVEIHMPIYEYTCEDCKSSFEKLVPTMSGGDHADCPECGSSKAARKFSVFAVGAEGSKSSASQDAPMCGRCGGVPGSCQME